MKDIVITRTRLKRELIGFFICIIAAFGLNVYSIIKYDTSWSELFSTSYITLILALIIYVVAGVFRLVYLTFTRLFSKAGN
ncbi:MAG: hypothetical protein GY863_16965 [bacterium]|nr:hypothetical protein [bacterium]